MGLMFLINFFLLPHGRCGFFMPGAGHPSCNDSAGCSGTHLILKKLKIKTFCRIKIMFSESKIF
jgi:hypothetical protein